MGNAEDGRNTLLEDLDNITSYEEMVDNTNRWCPFIFDIYLLGVDALTAATKPMRRGE